MPEEYRLVVGLRLRHVGGLLSSQPGRRGSVAEYSQPKSGWALDATCPSEVHSWPVEMDKAEARLVDGACTYYCTWAVLDRAGFAGIDSSADCYTRFVRQTGPELGPGPGPGPVLGLVLGLVLVLVLGACTPGAGDFEIADDLRFMGGTNAWVNFC